MRSLVLESSPALRTSGFAFTAWQNAFRALDALGVGDKIRKQHPQAQAYVTIPSHPISPTVSLSPPPLDSGRLGLWKSGHWPAALLPRETDSPQDSSDACRLRVMSSSTGEVAQELDLTVQPKR